MNIFLSKPTMNSFKFSYCWRSSPLDFFYHLQISGLWVPVLDLQCGFQFLGLRRIWLVLPPFQVRLRSCLFYSLWFHYLSLCFRKLWCCLISPSSYPSWTVFVQPPTFLGRCLSRSCSYFSWCLFWARSWCCSAFIQHSTAWKAHSSLLLFLLHPHSFTTHYFHLHL